MCAQDDRDSKHGKREGELMIFVPKEVDPQQEPVVEKLETAVVEDELPRTTTSVIRIMRAKGRPEMADLVEELHSTHTSVLETTKRAKDLLKLLRTLQRKTTDAYPVVKPHVPVGEDA